jgi:hypothetical protein
LQQPFETQWDVIVNFDPDPVAILHNHPTSIDEFWLGYASRNPQLANRLSEIYDENHLGGKQAADLRITFLSASSATVVAGGSFSVTDTVSNVGSVPSGQPTTVRFSLVRFVGPGFSLTFPIGQRGVPSLTPGGPNNAATTTVTAPALSLPVRTGCEPVSMAGSIRLTAAMTAAT